MNPPWIEFPTIPFRSIGWRMGSGETYMNKWTSYFFSLSPEMKREYIESNPEPHDWPNWYNTIEEIRKLNEEDLILKKVRAEKQHSAKKWWKFWL